MPDQFEPLSSMDAAILGIEDKTNLMMLSGVLTFGKPLDVGKLRGLLNSRWLKHRRLRQRVVQSSMPMAWPYWEDDPNFHLKAHVHRVALPEPGDQAALRTFASDLVSTPLDFSKPLWQVHVIENYGDGGALLFRIHHAIGDVSALSNLLMSITDVEPGGAESGKETAVSPTPNGQFPNSQNQIVKQTNIAAMMSRKLLKKFAIAGLDILSDPEKAGDYVNKGVAYTQSTLQLALKILEPETAFSHKLGVRKHVAWSRPFSLSEVNHLRSVLGGTLNDVMVTAIVGGLRRYMLAHDKPVNAVRFRAAIPVNLRETNGVNQLGNKFGVVLLSVPLAMSDPIERLAEVRARMDQLKQSQDARAVYNLVTAFSFIPSGLQSPLVNQVGVLASAVITNVAGPLEPRYLTDQKIESGIFWAPQSGRVGLGITIFSFAEKVYIGINADPNVMPDPDAFVACLHTEYEWMLDLANREQ